jgi:hypothetical protein
MKSSDTWTKVLIANKLDKIKGQMSPRRVAMGTVILTLAIIAIISISAAGFILLSSRTSTPSGNDFQIVKSNVAVYGLPAVLGRCSAIAASCPPQTFNSSLVVELINYKGTYYYVYSGRIVNGGTVTMTHTDSTGGVTVTTLTQTQATTTYTAWFTNSTLYCVTPDMDTAPTCPVQS